MHELGPWNVILLIWWSQIQLTFRVLVIAFHQSFVIFVDYVLLWWCIKRKRAKELWSIWVSVLHKEKVFENLYVDCSKVLAIFPRVYDLAARKGILFFFFGIYIVVEFCSCEFLVGWCWNVLYIVDLIMFIIFLSINY